MHFISLIWLFVFSEVHGGVIPTKRDTFNPNGVIPTKRDTFNPNGVIPTKRDTFNPSNGVIPTKRDTFNPIGVIPAKRDAFNPNQLMEYYMHIRTNQNQYGSFHPNDLINTIVQYFKNGGTQDISDNQWGLSLYNPNNAIGQYMGRMQSPGTLGPDRNPNQVQGEQAQSVPHGTAFNPNALNEKLMQTAQSESGATHDAVNGFDPDSVNRQLMVDAANHNPNAEFMPKESHRTDSQSTALQSGGTEGKTSTMAGYGQTSTMVGHGQTSTMAGHRVEPLPAASGFNPDVLNAGLYNTMRYDPNSVNSAMLGLGSGDSSYGNTGTLNSKSSSENNPNAPHRDQSNQKQDGGVNAANNGDAGVKAGQQSNLATVATNLAHTSGKGSGSVDVTDNSLVSKVPGANTQTEAVFQKPGSNSQETTNTGAFSAAHANTHPLHQTEGNLHGIAQATNTGALGSNPFSSANTLQIAAGTGSTGSGRVETGTGSAGGSFSAGALGPQGSSYDNHGAPPGLPSSGELKQTDSAVPLASGIGGMG